MKTLSVVTLVLIALIGANAQESLAAGPIDIGADVGIQSKYVWRGQLLTDGPVLQPSVTLGLKGFSLNLWGNMDLTDEDKKDKNDAAEMTEIDFTLSYSKSFALIDCSIGAIVYTFPSLNTDAKTTEVFIGASAPVPGHPSITLYRDVELVEGLYGSVGASQSIPVGLVFGLEVSAAIGFGSKGYNEAYFNQDDFALNDLMIGLGVPFGVGDIVNVTPSVTFTSILNSDIKDYQEAQELDDSNVYFGITASCSF